MSNYGETLNDGWEPSKDYIQQDTEYLERLNPALFADYIAERQAMHNADSIKNFKVTRLPRGGTDEYEHFKPKSAPAKPTRGRKKNEPTPAEALKAKESKILNGLLDEMEESATNK